MHSLVTQTPFPDRQEHARERERRACSLFLDDPFQLELYSYTTAGEQVYAGFMVHRSRNQGNQGFTPTSTSTQSLSGRSSTQAS